MIRAEEKIRDNLSLKLSLLEEGLILLSNEEYLPNKQGTKGFVDILAKDLQNRYVIIELKRSKASSKEALHQILKYIEGIKENKSLKDDEIIAYIVSTEWNELLIPFSSFISKVPYSVIGYKLEVDKSFNPLSASKVNPLSLNNERFFSDEHLISFFKTKDSLKKGIKNHKDIFSKKGVEDYILIVLKKENYLYQSKLSGITARYDYILYNVAQVQSDDEYLKIIQENDKSLYDELVECHGEEKMTDLHGHAIYDCPPMFFAERYEMSYPAKFKHDLLEKEGWEVQYIIRGKKLEANVLLADETILNELQGSTGTNKQVYNKKFKSSNTASLQQVSKEIETCLVDNEIWLIGLKKALLEIKKEDSYLEGELNIYNPSNTLYSIYRFYLSGYIDTYGQVNMLKHFPHYTLEIKGNNNRLYFGCLDYVGSDTPFKEVIDRAYQKDSRKLLSTPSWGGYQANDIDITPLYGLEYSNYMIEKINGEDSYFKFDGFRYKPCDKIYMNNGIGEFYGNRRDFIMEVCSLFEEADLGVGFIL